MLPTICPTLMVAIRAVICAGVGLLTPSEIRIAAIWASKFCTCAETIAVKVTERALGEY